MLTRNTILFPSFPKQKQSLCSASASAADHCAALRRAQTSVITLFLVAAVKTNIDIASMIHFKDFFRRPINRAPNGAGWFRTKGGHYLRGTIIGQGDVDLETIVGIIKESGYNGYISVEFEGQEDCIYGCKVSLANAKRFFAEN